MSDGITRIGEVQVLNLIAPRWRRPGGAVCWSGRTCPASPHAGLRAWSSERSMTLAEQVVGRSRRVPCFLIEVPRETARAIVEELGQGLPGCGGCTTGCCRSSRAAISVEQGPTPGRSPLC